MSADPFTPPEIDPLELWCERCGQRSRYVEMRDGVAMHPMCHQASDLGLYQTDPALAGLPNLRAHMHRRNARILREDVR